jgi:hypothetical protein
MEMGLKPTTEIPCPPLQVLPVNTMFVPLLMARQSSTYLKMDQHARRCAFKLYIPWFFTVLEEMVTSCAETSKPSVLCPESDG